MSLQTLTTKRLPLLMKEKQLFLKRVKRQLLMNMNTDAAAIIMKPTNVEKSCGCGHHHGAEHCGCKHEGHDEEHHCCCHHHERKA